MRKLILFMALLTAVGGAQTTSFYTDRAVGTFPVGSGTAKITVLIPIQFGPVRVCSLPLTQTQPCLPLATITDINSNPISNSIGGGFGQISTDVVGRFTFGCQVNLNYQIQVAPASSNVPQLNYPITCPGTGPNPSFTTITTNSITTEKPWVNAQFFGADPTGVADSTTAIQNAINFAMASGNCNPLYFPVGTYKVTSALTYNWANCNEILVYGDGPQASTISYTAATGNLFTCTGTAAQRKSLGFRNLGLKATAATTAVAISYTACQRLHVQNMQITGFFGGIRITGTGLVGDGTSGNSFDIHIENSLINNYVPGGYAINSDHVTDLFLNQLDNYGVGDSDVTSTSVVFDTGANGIYVTSVNTVSGLHSYIFRNTNQGGAFGGVPSGFYGVDVLGDTPAGGDAWLFDSTLSANNVTFNCEACWGRRSGITSAGVTNNPNAIGINVSGGSDIHFVNGWAIENALNGISATSTGANISFDNMNVQRNNFNNNTANTPGAIVNANPTRVRFMGGMYNNLGGGNQNFGIDYSANASTTVLNIDGDNNASGPLNPSSAPTKVVRMSVLASPDTFISTDTGSFGRMGNTTKFSWIANSLAANLNGISKDTSDIFTLGDVAGVRFSGAARLAEVTAPSGVAAFDVCYGDSTAHAVKCSYNNGSFFNLPQTILSGTATMTTAAIAAGACGTTVTVAATGVATTDTITWAFNATPAGTNAGIVAWPTANNVNFAYCPGVAETPAAATINWRVVR